LIYFFLFIRSKKEPKKIILNNNSTR